MLSFYSIVRQWKGPKMQPCCTYQTRLQITTPPESPQNTDTSILWTHSGDPNGFHFRSNSTWYVLNSLNNPAAHLPLLNNCAPHLVDSKAEHYISIVAHCAKVCPQCNTLVHVRGQSAYGQLRQWKVQKWSHVVLPAQLQITTPPGSPQNTDTSILWTHRGDPNGVHFRGTPPYTYKSAKIRRTCPL